MTKISKPQRQALVESVLNERKQHRFLNDDNIRNARIKEYASVSTLRALESRGLVDGSEWKLTSAGRIVAIDLLHEGAAKEMEDAFEYRKMEEKRIDSALKIKHAIMQAHGLYNWEVEVMSSYRLRDMSLRYSIDLCQKRVGRPLSDLVSIGWTHNEYTVDTTGTSLTAHNAKRMGELMLIAAKIVESNILTS